MGSQESPMVRRLDIDRVIPAGGIRRVSAPTIVQGGLPFKVGVGREGR